MLWFDPFAFHSRSQIARALVNADNVSFIAERLARVNAAFDGGVGVDGMSGKVQKSREGNVAITFSG